MSKIPTWLQPILEAKGTLNTDGISRHARTTHCRRCGVITIRGLDEDRAALVAICDPHPLDGIGEVIALMNGRQTYQLVWRGRYELDHRDQYRIQGTPIVPGVHVCAEHRCHAPPLPTIPADPPTPRKAITDAVPF